MPRAVARGRVLPQSLSTDRRVGRLSLKAWAIFPLLWVNADDQGRLCGNPEEVKYTCCPNIDHITKADIRALLNELQDKLLIKLYLTPLSEAIQILDWWGDQKRTHSLQWAWPSDYPPPEGWKDHLRYKKSAKEVATLNWPVSGEDNNSSQVSIDIVSGERSGETTSPAKKSKHLELSPLPPTTEAGNGSGNGYGTGRGRGNSPEDSGEKSPPSLAGQPLEKVLTDTFPLAFGNPPNSRQLAQLRDLGKEISAAGGAPAQKVFDAFKEAAFQNKPHVSYVRAVLLDWLGIPRDRSP